jgi:predicted transcriptional regulator
MSFKQLKSYLDFLLGRDLLCVVNENFDPDLGLFKITNKGKEFLKTYRGLKDLVE